MSASEAGRIQDLMQAGWSLLLAGREADAAHLFSRVLLQDPVHEEARRGLDQARVAAAEAHRRLEAALEEAARALERGDRQAARRLAEDVVRQGGDRDRALSLLDRLDSRPGRLEHAESDRGTGPQESAPPSAASPAWARLGLAAGWALSFSLLAAGVGSRWESLLGVLEGKPRAMSAAAPSARALAPPSRGEQAVSDARRLLEQGDPMAALAALDRVAPEEPAYPLARQLRVQAQDALGSRSGAR